jgi:hypothetical protein
LSTQGKLEICDAGAEVTTYDSPPDYVAEAMARDNPALGAGDVSISTDAVAPVRNVLASLELHLNGVE